MNIHHLELFYYVARHAGISEAVRNMPYGIQQPAMSSQVIQLEEGLGVTLFQRRPFRLTPEGEELYAFIRPFFEQLEDVEARLRSGGKHQHIRIGAAEEILRDHVPVPLQQLKRKHPHLKLTLRNGYLQQLESWLLRNEIDFAVTLVDGKAPSGLNSIPLLELPLGLVLPKSSKIQNAAELWRLDRIDDTLISPPVNESIARSFQRGLAQVGVDWFPGIELSSLDAIEAYVSHGYGIGLTVIVPRAEHLPEVRLLSLPDFPTVTIGALWQGKLTPITQAFLTELQLRAKQLGAPAARKSGASPDA